MFWRLPGRPEHRDVSEQDVVLQRQVSPMSTTSPAHARGGAPVERLTHGVDPSLKDLIFQLLDAGLF